MTLTAKKFGPLNTNIKSISDFLEPEIQLPTSDEISIIYDTKNAVKHKMTHANQKSKTSKKKEVRKKIEDRKQTKLNFGIVQQNTDTLIELSSDSDGDGKEKPMSSKSFQVLSQYIRNFRQKNKILLTRKEIEQKL